MVCSRSARLVVTVAVVSIGLTAVGVLSPRHLKAGSGTGKDAGRADVLTNAEGLRSDDRTDREDVANAIRAARAQLIEHLIQLAEEPGQGVPIPGTQEVAYPWHEPRHLAILLLGDLRASEAVVLLLENIEYKNPREMFGGLLNKSGWYPAVETLSKIGMPAVGPLLDKLGQVGPTSTAGDLYCWTLKEILGMRLARARIQIAIEETQNDTAKANLQAALPYFMTPQEKAAQEQLKKQ